MRSNHRARSVVLLIAITSFASPFASLPAAQSATGTDPAVPPNAFCRLGACGYGRDGISQPYTGRGITGLQSGPRQRQDDSLGFAASGVNLLSWLAGTELTGTPTNANDIWGYTSPGGREYAIVGLKTGTAFVDITDAINPTVVKVIPGRVSNWRDMAVYEQFAYSVNEAGDGIQVIDLSRIDRGRVRLRRTITALGLRTAHNIFVNEDSGFAYLLGSNLARGGLVAVDVRRPDRPRLEQVAWNAAYVHDVQVVSYTRGRYKGREIAFAFTGPLGLHIIDVTDKSAPVTLSQLFYDNATYGHSGWLSPNRKFLYINDELDERFNGNVDAMTTYIVRVGQLERPRLVNRVVWDIAAIDHNSIVYDNKLFISAYHAGLRILDLANPRQPRIGGWFDTYPADDEAIFGGAWGVYAGFPSGNVIVSDIERGLFVLSPDAAGPAAIPATAATR